MIKTLSTYNLIVPFLSPLTSAICTEYTASIYIWSGEKAGVPASPEYEITKQNLVTSSGNDKIQVGRLVNDFIKFTPTNSGTMEVLDTTNQVWVKTEVVYVTADPLDDGTVQSEATQLALKGYGYGIEGENPQPSADGILIETDMLRVSRDSRTTIGLLLDAAKVGTVISYPDNTIDYSFNLGIETHSDDIVKLLNIPTPADEDYIQVVIGARTINLPIIEEYKYTPVDVYFLNKDGTQQSLTFFKERKDSMTVNRENYESIAGQPSDGYHQFVDFNVNGRTKLSLTSGYVPEAQNSAFKELMLSSRVFIYEGDFIPINVVNSTIEYQTRLNERLISYDIEFNYSYAEVNNI